MKKELRLILGITLHPFKRIWELAYRKAENDLLERMAKLNERSKMHERMHNMSDVTGTSFMSSELYKKLGL